MSIKSSLKVRDCFQTTELAPIFDDRRQSFKEKSMVNFSEKKHVCSTCKQEINADISRILIMRDKDGGPRLFCFHFFFPCWDFTQICQDNPDLVIDSAGFSIPANISMRESSLQDLQKNLEFWR